MIRDVLCASVVKSSLGSLPLEHFPKHFSDRNRPRYLSHALRCIVVSRSTRECRGAPLFTPLYDILQRVKFPFPFNNLAQFPAFLPLQRF